METEIAEQLLMSIRSGRLVVMCGAGLSMALPSDVPSAALLAEECSQKYQNMGLNVPPGTERDLERLSDYFSHAGMLQDFTNLVEWYPFTHDPNAGHEAVADFLGCHAVSFAVTTNYDLLVETAATNLGEPNFENAIDANELIQAHPHAFYMKIHGCCFKDKPRTVWCLHQIGADPTIQDRISSLEIWLRANLAGKDLLLVGFWSDWGYLNSIFEGILNPVQANRVILVDPDDSRNLAAKAPSLWTWANAPGVRFSHVQESGAKFLEELRRRFGLMYFGELLNQSSATFGAIAGAGTPIVFPNLSRLRASDLFELRRDSDGIPNGRMPRRTRPEPTMNEFGARHLAFAALGADLDQTRYLSGGTRYRIVQGAGQGIGEVKNKFSREPPETIATDVVICAGAFDDGGITSIVRGASSPSIVRGGSSAEWITSPEASARLGI